MQEIVAGWGGGWGGSCKPGAKAQPPAASRTCCWVAAPFSVMQEIVAVWVAAAVFLSATTGLLTKEAPAERRTPEPGMPTMRNSSSMCCPRLPPDPSMESCAAIAIVTTFAGSPCFRLISRENSVKKFSNVPHPTCSKAACPPSAKALCEPGFRSEEPPGGEEGRFSGAPLYLKNN